MKKKITMCLCLLILFSMVSCSSFEKHGISQYHSGNSKIELTLYFFPTENGDFLKMFDYTWGDYHYYDAPFLSVSSLEKAIAVLKYDEEIYRKAKQYCLDNMYLSATNIKEYSGYVFVENLAHPESFGRVKNGANQDFPQIFTMFGYNDALNTLVFIGFCSENAFSKKDDPKAAYAETDFGKFLDIFYSEYYDFNAK